MTTINAVTVTPQHLCLSLQILPKPRSPAFLQTHPGNLVVGYWDSADGLTLYLPDGTKREMTCSVADEAARQAGLVWNTPAGRAVVKRCIAGHADRLRFDWAYHEISETVKNAIESACVRGASLRRVVEAALDAALMKLAAVHGEHDAHKIVTQWYDEWFEDVGCGYFGPVFPDPDDIDPGVFPASLRKYTVAHCTPY